MGNEAVSLREHLTLVPGDASQEDQGHAVVVGHFPPVVSNAAAHASALLYLFRMAGI